MRKNLLFILTVFFSGYSFSQISFEKGYYIDNSDNKVNCLIRNVDWKNNPTEFEYKLSDDSGIETLNISSAKEFGIDKDSRYVRAIVNLERSDPNFASTLTENSQPQFNEEELFLKVLIQGKANLYTYSANSITKYFYNIDNSDIEQLIFIKYKTPANNIQTNQYYKQQLWLNLKCESILMDDINHLDFKRNDLINFFTKYNVCNQSEIVNYQANQKRGSFNVTLRPRLNNSALTIQTYEGTSSSFNVDFDSKLNLGFGIEAEFILPFNKNKWGVLIEPTYKAFKNEKTYEIGSSSSTLITSKIDYNSIELPLGIRHYFFLDDESKIFINALFTIDFLLNSNLEYTRDNGTRHGSLEVSTGNNFTLGIGYKYSNKYSIELRNHFERNILKNNMVYTSNYNSLSLIVGYTIF